MARTFLVIDANEADAARTAGMLRSIEPAATVLLAGDGSAALALLEEQRVVPALTFLDFGSHGMNAMDFLGQVRSRRWLERAPVAMLSRVIADRDVVTCYRLGAAAFLTKPVRVHELRETLRDFALPAGQAALSRIFDRNGTFRTAA